MRSNSVATFVMLVSLGLAVATDALANPVFTGSKTTELNVASDGSGMQNVDIEALGASDWACWLNAIGAPTERKAGGTAIGNLQEVGSPGGPNAWEFTKFVWTSGGTPTATSAFPGFAAGVTSSAGGSGLAAGEGYSIEIALPTESGSITFWGVSRNALNNLSITNASGTLYSDSYNRAAAAWDVTTFTMTWSGATPGEVVTLNWLYASGSSARVGLTGIALSPVTRHPSFTGSKVTTTGVAADGSSMQDIDIDALGTSDWACWQNAIGTPTQQKAGSSLIGDLQEVGSPGGPNAWEFTSFTWPSGGDPLAVSSSPGYAAGVVSGSPVSADEGHRIDVELPGISGTITFWGVARDATDDLTVLHEGYVLYKDTFTAPGGRWDVTTFTLDWDNAEPGDQVTVRSTFSGSGGSERVGLTGIAVSNATLFPVVDITNGNASVGSEIATYTIGGTNNATVVGSMSWTNTLTGSNAMFSAMTPWSISGIALGVGANVITVSGTNASGVVASDSVTITRAPPATAPFVSITNANATVSGAVTSYTVGGTNNAYVVGTMSWTNTLTGGSATFAATTPWSISGIPLDVGANVITVSGTNASGTVGSDSVTITRAAPFLDITNANATVASAVTSYTVGGTNDVSIVGTMSWTNSLTGGSATFAATTPWSVSGIGLDEGDNVITVSGTNVTGDVASDSVTITRLLDHSGILFFDDFDGSSSDLHGAAPDVRLSDETWVAMSVFNRNGSLDNANRSGTATLALAPQHGKVYVADCVVTNTGTLGLLYFGFVEGQSSANSTLNRFVGTQTYGQPWMVYNCEGGNNYTYVGPGSSDYANWTALTTANGLMFMRLVLDTTGGTGNWKATWYAKQSAGDGYTEVRAETALPSAVESITSVGFGYPRRLTGPASLISFTLSAGLLNPVVDITNANASVAHAVTSTTIGGTNTASVVGTMSWTNSLTGSSATFAAATPWSIPGIALAVGANVITVSGTNLLNEVASDSITITRDPPATAPVVYITNANASVGSEISSYTIGGTNNENVVGTMSWSNSLTQVSATFAASTPWSIPGIALDVGANVITVSATNAAGAVGNDSITITRAAPVVIITNGNATVASTVTTYTLGGTTDVSVVGTMTWSNSATQASATFAATTPWSAGGIPLAEGANVIIVSGTNATGDVASDSVTITRLQVHNGVLYFDDFSGSIGDPLNGTTPDVTLDAASWVAHSSFKADGTLNSAPNAGKSATLAFIPQPDTIYILDCEVNHTALGSAEQLGFGFADGQSTAGGNNNRFLGGDTSGRAWMQVVTNANNLTLIAPNFTGSAAWTSLEDQSGPMFMRIKLDTNGGATNATWYAKQNAGDPYLEVRAVTTVNSGPITSVGFAVPRNVDSSLISFTLEVPDNATTVIMFK